MRWASHQKILGRRALKIAFFASPFAPVNMQQKDFRVLYLPTGQPAIAGALCHASIAHTCDWAIGAVAKHIVGVDIEHMRRRVAEKELLRYIASSYEQINAQLHTTEPARALTLLWVIKESVRKCLGVRRPVTPKELIIVKRERDILFVRWRKNNALYKVYVKEYKHIVVARAFPVQSKERITYRIIHTHANIYIQ